MLATPMSLHRWDEEWGPLTENSLRDRLAQGGFRVTRYVYPPGTYFPDHTHDVDKKDGVYSGQFRLRMLGQDLVLGPGDYIEVPAGTVHSAEVVGTEPVVSFDATRERT
jgi:quercetin dioxygenase-like cupin family protein